MKNDEQVFSESFVEDQTLLEQHRAGDPAAYGRLFEKHSEMAYNYAYRHVNSEDRADDLVLEAFTKILETIRRGKGPTVSMGHYLATTIRTLAVTSKARERAELSNDPQLVAELYEREQFADSGSAVGWVADAFNSLGERAQRVLWLRSVEGLLSKEVADEIGVSPSTATRVYLQAVRDLRVIFVETSLRAAPEEECQAYETLLNELAQKPVNERQGAPKAIRAHLGTCLHCATVVSRLRAPARVLMSTVFIAGLGTLAVDALRTTQVAHAASFAAPWGWGLGAKLSTIVVPVLVASAVVTTVLWPSHHDEIPLSGGNSTIGSSETLVRIGSCALIRESLDGPNEVWRLSTEASDCHVRIDFLAHASEDAGSDVAAASVRYMDTRAEPELRTREIVRPGRYTVTLTAGTASKTETITVLPRE